MNSFIPDDTTIVTERLTLTALTVADADEMVNVLNDERLHEYTGDRPATLDELRGRYRGYLAGPADRNEIWLNWIIRRTHDAFAVGTVQATVYPPSSADVAWVVGTLWQRQGYATEAARALVRWLGGLGIDKITANIHPDHHASATVASRAGLHPTDEQLDGETVWRNNELT